MDKIKLKRKIFKLSNFITFKRKMYFLILCMILEPISLIFFGALYFNNFNLNETFLKLATYSNDVIDAYIIIALFFGSFKFIFIDYWNK